MRRYLNGNKSLFASAARSGVQSPNFGLFEDAGILGQYTLTTAELEEKRNIPRGALYDTMAPHELAGNLLRITMTDHNLQVKNIQGEEAAMNEHHSNGRQVREVMKSMSGGENPEDIKPIPSIKNLLLERRRAAKKRKENKPPDTQDTLL